MTRLMEQVIERLRAIPDGEQDQLAEFLLNELQDDQRWLDSTAAHATGLHRMIQSVLKDDAGGKCEPLDVDRL